MHDELVEKAVQRLQSYVEKPSDQEREELRELLRELESVNDEYESIPYGVVRIIQDKNVLIVEDAAGRVRQGRGAGDALHRTAV